ncbi:MAG TPA: hypothetical protein VGC47_11150 [Acidimicrobiia bacterium]
MATESRLAAAFRRLEAQRSELEHQIVTELDELFFGAEQPVVVEMATSDPFRYSTDSLGTAATDTAINCHVTTTWFEA